MIRIDEIYYNVFFPRVQDRPDIVCHWFDPFGSKCFKDLMNHPKIEQGHRIIFWDQEPLYKADAAIFFDKFCEIYLPLQNTAYHTTVTLITSELNSREVKWVQDTYKLENTAHYFFHGWAALDWYRGYNHSFLSIPFDQRKITTI